jgi:hypothetical protein
MISIRLRRLYRRLSYLTGWSRDFPTRDARFDTLRLQGISKPVGVVAPVAQEPARFWQIVQ